MKDLSDQAKQKATAKIQENRSSPEVQQKVRRLQTHRPPTVPTNAGATVLEHRPAETKVAQKAQVSDRLGDMPPLGTPPRLNLTQQPHAPLSAPIQMHLPQASPAVSPAFLPMTSPIAPNGVGGSMTMSIPALPSLKDQLVELVSPEPLHQLRLVRTFSWHSECHILAHLLIIRSPRLRCLVAVLHLCRKS